MGNYSMWEDALCKRNEEMKWRERRREEFEYDMVQL